MILNLEYRELDEQGWGFPSSVILISYCAPNSKKYAREYIDREGRGEEENEPPICRLIDQITSRSKSFSSLFHVRSFLIPLFLPPLFHRSISQRRETGHFYLCAVPSPLPPLALSTPVPYYLEHTLPNFTLLNLPVILRGHMVTFFFTPGFSAPMYLLLIGISMHSRHFFIHLHHPMHAA